MSKPPRSATIQDSEFRILVRKKTPYTGKLWKNFSAARNKNKYTLIERQKSLLQKYILTGLHRKKNTVKC